MTESVEVPFSQEDSSSAVALQDHRAFAKRWKHEALFANGFVGVPALFLRAYAKLNPPLTSGEALFVVHMMQYKWDEKAPFPSYKTIAAQMGISIKMARRHAQSLELKKYLRREGRIGQTNRFELTPLFNALLRAVETGRIAG